MNFCHRCGYKTFFNCCLRCYWSENMCICKRKKRHSLRVFSFTGDLFTGKEADFIQKEEKK